MVSLQLYCTTTHNDIIVMVYTICKIGVYANVLPRPWSSELCC